MEELEAVFVFKGVPYVYKEGVGCNPPVGKCELGLKYDCSVPWVDPPCKALDKSLGIKRGGFVKL